MPPSMRWSSVIPSPNTYTKHICPSGQTSRCFSATPWNDAPRVTRQRRELFRWLSAEGAVFREPLPGSTNYLSAYNKNGRLRRVVEKQKEGGVDQNKSNDEDNELLDNADEDGTRVEDRDNQNKLPVERKTDRRPFPLNKAFVSEPVLSEDFREKIWESIMKEGLSVRQVSANLGVEMSRVGAVVRLKEIEKEWQREGKTLAKPYARAVLGMLPQTKWNSKSRVDEDGRKTRTHESINDLPVHPATTVQIFHPTSESRHFTRKDAAKVFDEDLLPTDKRIPHPELVETQRDRSAGLPAEIIQQRAQAREEKEMREKQKLEAYFAKKAADVKKVDTGRWEFRFKEINVDDAGTDGRGPMGTGWRYGAPLMDRSRGQVKIPTRVE